VASLSFEVVEVTPVRHTEVHDDEAKSSVLDQLQGIVDRASLPDFVPTVIGQNVGYQLGRVRVIVDHQDIFRLTHTFRSRRLRI